MNSVLIVLPVYKPDYGFLHLQLKSIQDQSYEDYECVVSYDGQFPLEVRNIIEPFIHDKRFSLFERENHLGTYRHIEHLISNKFNGHQFLALSDQDDVWEIDKLKSQISVLEEKKVSIVSDDAYLIDGLGIAKSAGLFKMLSIDLRSLDYICYINSCSGAGSLYDKEVVQKAIPFPPSQVGLFHDHWLAAVGMCLLGIELREFQSWSYRQHAFNQIGVPSSKLSLQYIRLIRSKINSIVSQVFDSQQSETNKVAEVIEKSLYARGLEIPDSCCTPSMHSTFKGSWKHLSISALMSSRFTSLGIFFNRIE